MKKYIYLFTLLLSLVVLLIAIFLAETGKGSLLFNGIVLMISSLFLYIHEIKKRDKEN